MAIPHKTDPYAKLSSVVKMPPRQLDEPGSVGAGGERSGRRRRRQR